MLTFQSLTRLRHNRAVFAPLNETVHPKEALWVQGKNGSGKTTLLRILSGLISYQGDVLWQGKSIEQCKSDYVQQTAYLGHQHGLYHDLNAEENLACALKWREGASPVSSEIKDALLEYPTKPIARLSEGQKRKVAWLRVLQANARFWFLDEPFNALDVGTCDYLESLCQKHLAQGGSLVVTSHHTCLQNTPHRKLVLKEGA